MPHQKKKDPLSFTLRILQHIAQLVGSVNLDILFPEKLTHQREEFLF